MRTVNGRVSPDDYGGIALTVVDPSRGSDHRYHFPLEVILPFPSPPSGSRPTRKVKVILSATDIPVAYEDARGRHTILYP